MSGRRDGVKDKARRRESATASMADNRGATRALAPDWRPRRAGLFWVAPSSLVAYRPRACALLVPRLTPKSLRQTCIAAQFVCIRSPLAEIKKYGYPYYKEVRICWLNGHPRTKSPF